MIGLPMVALVNLFPFLGAETGDPKVLPPGKSALAQRQTQAIANCNKPSVFQNRYKVIGNANTVQWGFFSKKSSPVLAVDSKDYVTMDLITHHAGDDYERIIQGDPGIECIYRWIATGKKVSDRGLGVHVPTGPVYICDAEPGNLLEVRILDLKLNQKISKLTHYKTIIAKTGILVGAQSPLSPP